MKRAPFALLGACVVSFVVGCGSSTTPTDDAGADGGATDSATDGSLGTDAQTAAEAGTRLDAGPFPCGSGTCGGDQYCETTVGGACEPTDAGCMASTTSACRAFPAACSACACLPDVHGNNACQCDDGNGLVRVTCYAP